MKHFRKIILFILLLPIFLLTACNGGGEALSTNSATPSPTPKPTIPVLEGNEQGDEIPDSGIILQNERLKVEICKPGVDYTADRFDWAGIIKQVTLDGEYTFLSKEDPFDAENKSGGIGIINAFEPKVGKLIKANYSVKKIGDYAAVFYYKDVNKEGISTLKFIRTIQLDGNKIIISNELSNLSADKKLSVTEYNHNFFQIDGKMTGPDYELSFPYTPEKGDPVAGISDIFTFADKTISWSKELNLDEDKTKLEEREEDCLMQIKGFDHETKNYWWKLTYKPTGVGVKATNDFKMSTVKNQSFQLWCRRYCICPEVFYKETAEPQSTLNWTRTYEFFTNDDAG